MRRRGGGRGKSGRTIEGQESAGLFYHWSAEGSCRTSRDHESSGPPAGERSAPLALTRKTIVLPSLFGSVLGLVSMLTVALSVTKQA